MKSDSKMAGDSGSGHPPMPGKKTRNKKFVKSNLVRKLRENDFRFM